MDKETKKIILEKLGIFIIIFVLTIGIFEVVLLGIAYFNADEVTCNWLWCEFKTTRQESIIMSTCYENGKQVRCEETINIECIDNFKQGFCDSLYYNVKFKLASGIESMRECSCNFTK